MVRREPEVMMIDEGCQYRTTIIDHKGGKNQPSDTMMATL